MDAQWSDDFHHSLFTLLYDKEPGRGYYDDFGTMAQLTKALKEAFVYDGEYSSYRQHAHGRPVGSLSAHHFITFDQNHDQVGNRALGERLEHLVGFEAAKVAIGIVLTAPFLPMLFMGEEFVTTTPFLYFADHEEEEMRRLVSEGRKRDFAQFGFGEADVPDPEEIATFQRSKLNWSEVHHGNHAEMLEWTKNLIKLRRTTLSLNDGDFGHLHVDSDAKEKWISMRRGEIRILANMGSDPVTLPLEDCEELTLASRTEVATANRSLLLPSMSLAILTQCETNGME